MMKPLLLCFIFMTGSICAEETYVYHKDVEGRISKTTWTVDVKREEVHIAGESRGSKTLIVTTSERMTKSFSHQSKGGSDACSIVRAGSKLIAKGTENGKHFEKQFKLGKAFWVQEFDFSLKPFILSNDHDFKFSIIRPKKLDLHEMVATKQSIEKLEINGEMREAIKVKVTLTGFKKMFWHADLWFDLKSGDLLKYMANEGPNTPLSVITLFSKQTKNS